ncbi:dUTP diphosphatase [Agromyces humi]|uniref:dUTP diphosphatase n=1 Tax=Agromyces humi TaxID=1766800 RepID=UPI0013577ECE|nr:dUTP diphosphatase [Agromyces humi]
MTTIAADLEVEQINIKFKRLHPDAVIPKQAKYGDAGVDARSVDTYVLEPGDTVLVHTGFAVEMPYDTVMQVCSRSGLALNHSIIVLNAPGLVDAGYRGEIMVILHNASRKQFTVNPGDRIAQLMFQRYLVPVFVETNELSASDRGAGGAGHTGIA